MTNTRLPSGEVRLRERILMMMLGRQFGKLKVISALKDEGWFCRCECGNAVDVEERHLFSYPKRVACGECGPSAMQAPWVRPPE